MHLYLVQHGEAVDECIDPERPLTDKGRTETIKVAVHAGQRAGIEVLAVAHSGKLRARQTAELIALEIQTMQGVVPVKDLEPNANPGIWVERLTLIEDDVILVGHLPHLSRLASALVCGNPDKPVVAFCNSGMVCLKKERPDQWVIEWLLTPELVID